MKKFFSAFLLMTAMVLSVGTFVACNDLVDDVEDLKSQTTQNAADIAAIKTQIATLEQGIAEAKQAAADAKTFAEKCAAEAKAEALAEAKAYAESLNDATKEELATLKGKVEGIDDRLSTLEGEVDKQAEAIANIELQIAALEKYNKETQDPKIDKLIEDLESANAKILANANNIASLQTDLQAVQEKIAEIDEALVTLEDLVYNVLKSIAYIPEKIDTLLNEIEDGFKSIMRPVAAGGFEYVSSNCVTFNYRVNPANAEIAVEDLSFIAIGVETRAEEENVFVIDAEKTVKTGDKLAVTVKSKTDIPGDKQTGLDGKKAKLVALKVANDNYSIVSDYTAVADVDLKNYTIRNKKADDKVEFFNYDWYAQRPAALGDATKTEFYPVVTKTTPVELVHNGKVNLREYVETYCTELEATLDSYECMKPDYTFSVDFTYISPVDDDDTDQNDFVAVTADGMLEVEFNGKLDTMDQTSTIVAVGKTPVVEVIAWVAGKEIKKAYIKVDIVEEPTVPPTPKDPVKITFPAKTYEYNALTDKDGTPDFKYVETSADWVTWSNLTMKVLADKGIYMSNEMFEKVYYFAADGKTQVYPTVNITGTHGDDAGVDFATDPHSATATTTTYVGYALNSLVNENCEGTVTIKFASNDVYTYPDVLLEFPFAVTHKTDLPGLNKEYAENGIVVVKGHSNPTATTFEWTYEVFLHEAFELQSYENWTCNNANHSALAFKIDTDSPAILFTDQTMKYTPDLTDDEDWQTVKMTLNLDGEGDHADFETDILYNHNEANAGTVRNDASKKVNDLIWDASGYLDVPVTLYTVLDNGNTCEFEYKVRFVNPFAITLNNISLATSSLGTTYDALQDITITFNGQPVYENADYTQLGRDLKLVGHLGHEFSLVINDAALADDQEEIVKGINDFGYPTDNDSKKWLHWYDEAVIYWNNGGSVLNHDVVFDSTVYGFCDQIGWFTIAQPATVTLLNNK